MSATVRLAFAASITATGLAATASTAAAQEGPPGACACAAPAAPVLAVAAPDPLPKWGVGLHATSLGLAAERTPDDQTQYAGGGLQLRYRLTPRWQLELSLDHVREQLENGDEGDRQLDATTLSALYHFRPYARWDWYLLAGIGGMTDGDPEASDAVREASARGLIQAGVGVERRFRHLAIGAELRAVGLSPRQAAADDAPEAQPTGAPAMTVPTSVIEEDGLSGGQLTIAGTYYF